MTPSPGVTTPPEGNPYVDDRGVHFGYCNACGEEAELDQACADPECKGGEVVPYDDDPDGDLQ